MKAIQFEWKTAGDNNGHPIWEVSAFGHNGKVMNAKDTNLWTIRIDNIGTRHIPSEADAKSMVEQQITFNIERRIKTALDDLALLSPLLDTPETTMAKRAFLQDAVSGIYNHNELNGDSDLVLFEKQEVIDTLTQKLADRFFYSPPQANPSE